MMEQNLRSEFMVGYIIIVWRGQEWEGAYILKLLSNWIRSLLGDIQLRKQLGTHVWSLVVETEGQCRIKTKFTGIVNDSICP